MFARIRGTSGQVRIEPGRINDCVHQPQRPVAFRICEGERATCGCEQRRYESLFQSKELIDTTQVSGNVNTVTFRQDGEVMFVSGGKTIAHPRQHRKRTVVRLDEGIVTVFDVRRRAAIHRFTDDGSYSTTSMCVASNQQYFVTG